MKFDRTETFQSASLCSSNTFHVRMVCCSARACEWDYHRRYGTKTRTNPTALTSPLGTSWGGLLLPLILPPLLNKYGIPKTLRFLGIAQGIILVIILPFIRGRLPESRVHGPDARGRSTSGAPGQVYFHNKIFWFIILATLLQGLAYFIPILWLPCAYNTHPPKIDCVSLAPFNSLRILLATEL